MEEKRYLPGSTRTRIQDLMAERKMTVSALAEKMGCDDTTLGRYLRGETKKISDDALIHAARVFGVSLDFLMGETDTPERLNYALSDLGLTVKAAQNLCTGKVDPVAVSLLLENEEFAKLSQLLSHFFAGTFVSAFAAQNQMYRTLAPRLLSSAPGEDGQAAARDIGLLAAPLAQEDLRQMEYSFSKAIKEIRRDLEALSAEKRAEDARLTKAIIMKMWTQATKGKKPQKLTAKDLAAALVDVVSEGRDFSQDKKLEIQKTALKLFRETTKPDGLQQ